MVKSNVPFMATPRGCIIIWSFVFVAYLLLLVSEAAARPGIAEATLGITYGLVAGLLLGRMWVAYLKRVTEEAARRPWLKWATLFAYPLPPFLSHFAYRLLAATLLLGGFFGLWFTAELLQRLMPRLELPWARFNSPGLSESAFASTVLYGLAMFTMVTIMGFRWYRSLPD